MNTLYPMAQDPLKMSQAEMKSEAAWNVRQSLLPADRFHTCENPPAPFAPTVSESLKGYTFAPYEFRTLSAGGVCTQASLLIQHPTDPTDRFIVTCDTSTGVAEWSAQCPPFRKWEGPAFIAAAQRRIEQNRARNGAVN